MKQVILAVIIILASAITAFAVVDSVVVSVLVEFGGGAFDSGFPLDYPNRGHVLALSTAGHFIVFTAGGTSSFNIWLTTDYGATWADSINLNAAGYTGGPGDHMHFHVRGDTIWVSGPGGTSNPQGVVGRISAVGGTLTNLGFYTTTIEENLVANASGPYKHGGSFIPLPGSDSALVGWRSAGNTPPDNRLFDVSANWTTDGGETMGARTYIADMNETANPNGSRVGFDYYDNSIVLGMYYRDNRFTVHAFDPATQAWSQVSDTIWTQTMERWYGFGTQHDSIIYAGVPTLGSDTILWARKTKGESAWTKGILCDSTRDGERNGIDFTEIESSNRMVATFSNATPGGNNKLYMRWFAPDSAHPSTATYELLGDSVPFVNFAVSRRMPAAHGDRYYVYYSTPSVYRVLDVQFFESSEGCDISLTEAKWWHLDTCERIIVDYAECAAPVSKIVLLRDSDAEIEGASRIDSVTSSITNPDTLHMGNLTKGTMYFYWVEITHAGGVDTSLVQWVTTRPEDVYIVNALPHTADVDDRLILPHPDSQGVVNSDGDGLEIKGVRNIVRGWQINFGNDSGQNYAGIRMRGDATGYGAQHILIDSMKIYHAPEVNMTVDTNQPISINATGIVMGNSRDAIDHVVQNCTIMVKGRDAKCIDGSSNGSFHSMNHKIIGNVFIDSSQAFRRRDYFNYGPVIYITTTSNQSQQDPDYNGWHWQITHNKVLLAPWVNLAIDPSLSTDSSRIYVAYNSWFVDQINRHDTTYGSSETGSTQFDSPAQGYGIAVRGLGHILVEHDTIRAGTNFSGGRGVFITGIGTADHVDSAIVVRNLDIDVHQGWNGYDENAMGIEARQQANNLYIYGNTVKLTQDTTTTSFRWVGGASDDHASPTDTFDHIGPLVQGIKMEEPRQGIGSYGTIEKPNVRRIWGNTIIIECLEEFNPWLNSGRWHYAAGIVTSVTGEGVDPEDHRPPVYDSGNTVITDHVAFMFGAEPNGGVMNVELHYDSVHFTGKYPAIERLLAIGDYGAYSGGDSNFVRGLRLQEGSEKDTSWHLQSGGSAGSASVALQQTLSVHVKDSVGANVNGASVYVFNQFGNPANLGTALDNGTTGTDGLWTSDWLSYFYRSELGSDTLLADYGPFTAVAVLDADTTSDTIWLRWNHHELELVLSESEAPQQQHRRVKKRGFHTRGVEIR